MSRLTFDADVEDSDSYLDGMNSTELFLQPTVHLYTLAREGNSQATPDGEGRIHFSTSQFSNDGGNCKA